MHSNAIGIPELSLRQLKSALYVSQYRNVTKAAYQLNRSQTTVTKAISDLESSLGKELFDRSSNGMMPTVYGTALSHRVELAAAEFAKAGEQYQEFVPDGRKYSSIPIFSLDISYKRLAAFLALYQVRNITRAAEILNITKAAVYNSVRQLEELLDLTLFEREPNGAAPTPFCHILARHSKLAFSEIRHALEDLANIDGVTQGRVTIGTLPYTRTFLTPRAINRLLARHPQLDVSTQEGSYKVMEASLRSGDIDFIVGAVRTVDNQHDISTETLFEDKLSIIARKGHPLTQQSKLQLKDLQDADWVLAGKETPGRQLFDETMAKHGAVAPTHAVETSSLSMVRGLLLDSDRVALLSEHQIYYDKLNNILEVLPVELEDTYRPIGITMRAHTQPSPAAKLFLESLREVASELKDQ